jgi:hypothetical protein
MTHQRGVQLFDRLGRLALFGANCNHDANELDRAGRGEEADRVRTKADRGLKLQRKIATKLYYPGEVVAQECRGSGGRGRPRHKEISGGG